MPQGSDWDLNKVLKSTKQTSVVNLYSKFPWLHWLQHIFHDNNYQPATEVLEHATNFESQFKFKRHTETVQ